MTKYYKVLGEGFKTRNGFDWTKALDFKTWIKEPNSEISNEACGKGIHVWNDYPRYTIFQYITDHTFEVEIDSEILGQDEEKTRVRKIRFIRLVTKSEIFKPKANLWKADLSGAYLSGANLSGAYLSGANLLRADLSGADLSGAHNTRNIKELGQFKGVVHC